MPSFLQPKAGTTWYETFVDARAPGPKHIGILQAMLYGVPKETCGEFSYLRELVREGSWVGSVLFGVKEKEEDGKVKGRVDEETGGKKRGE
jgi:hypothetical protein